MIILFLDIFRVLDLAINFRSLKIFSSIIKRLRALNSQTLQMILDVVSINFF